MLKILRRFFWDSLGSGRFFGRYWQMFEGSVFHLKGLWRISFRESFGILLEIRGSACQAKDSPSKNTVNRLGPYRTLLHYPRQPFEKKWLEEFEFKMATIPHGLFFSLSRTINKPEPTAPTKRNSTCAFTADFFKTKRELSFTDIFIEDPPGRSSRPQQ